MSCVVSNINGNGVITANPTETLIVNTVDAAASTGALISGKEMYKIIQSAGYVMSGGKLNMPLLVDANNRQGRDITSIQSLARLNVHFAINYGATGPVFNYKVSNLKVILTQLDQVRLQRSSQLMTTM